ncbi:hypothetical protein AVEN_8295-1 [Araneus ventricosus]|uniref:Uncharacterized protein n=1 Tax=Araneus ventricosus TaxID=182803 RepID=A0A4Y2URB6_ARAVE|nr:hypothetical protein AVEN_8295-1 [Araneus ventricosus]
MHTYDIVSKWILVPLTLVLSTIARLFDPLDLLVPVAFGAKFLMQALCRLKIGWIDPLPKPECLEWHQFLIELESINSLKIGRRIVIEEAATIEFRCFAAASERCFEAAVYCKSQNSEG